MKYKVGDKVIIRSWESMEAECGLDARGCIPIRGLFTPEMRGWCGQTLTIISSNDVWYRLEGCEGYEFSDEMIEGLASDILPREEVKAMSEEKVDHPSHYNRDGAMECIEEMILVFGLNKTIDFCLLNAWKYRYRAADKNGIEDLKKSDWYMRKFKELGERMDEDPAKHGHWDDVDGYFGAIRGRCSNCENMLDCGLLTTHIAIAPIAVKRMGEVSE